MNSRLSELLTGIYEQAELLKLLTWNAVERTQDELEWSEEINPEERFIDAEASFDGKVLKVVVNDCLPRRPSMKPVLKSASLLRAYWTGNVVSAVKRIPVPVKFERALCVITVYTPKHTEWDVDNRAISMIINALRLTEVIPNDSWDRLSLLLCGGIDKKRPRTEITVVECPEKVGEKIIQLLT